MKCLVPGCRGKPVFKIPSNKCLREKWQNDFPFNITLIDNNLVGICVEHFKQDDIIYENNIKDQFGKELYHTCLKTVRLKDEAVPAIFPKQTPLTNLMRKRPIVKGPEIHPELIKVLESNNLNCLSDGQSDIDSKDIKKITRYDLWKYTGGKDPVLQVLPPLVAIKGKNPAAEQKKLTEVSPKPVEKKTKENSPQKNPAAEHKKLIEVSPKPVKKRPKEYSPRIIKFYHPWTKQTVVLEKVTPPINIIPRPVGSKRKQILIPVKDGSESEADKVQVVTPVIPGSSPQSDKDENPKIPLIINPKANQSIKSVEPNSNIAKDGSESKADKVQVVTPVLPRSSSQSDKDTDGKRKRPLIINPKANQLIKSLEPNSNIAKDGSKSEADKVQVVTPVLSGSSPQSDKDSHGKRKRPLIINPKANQLIKSGELNSNIAKDGSESKADKVQVVTPILPGSSSQSDKDTDGKRKRPLIINPTANQSIKPAELNSNIAKDGSESKADKVQVVTPILPGSSSQSDKHTHGKRKRPLIINPKANQLIKSVEPNSNIAKDGSESKADKVQVVTPVLPGSSSQSDKDTDGKRKRPLIINPTANQLIKSVEPNSNIAKDGSKSEADKVQVVTPVLSGSSPQSDKNSHGKRKTPLIINPKANQLIKSVEPNSNIAKDGSKSEADKVQVVTPVSPGSSPQSDKDSHGKRKTPLIINPKANQLIKSVEPNSNIAKDGSKSEADKVQVVTPVSPGSSSQSDKDSHGKRKTPLIINPKANQLIKSVEPNSNIAKDGSKSEADKVQVVTPVSPGSSSQSDKDGKPKIPLKINPTANQSIKSVEPNANIAKDGSESKADKVQVVTPILPGSSSQSDKHTDGNPKRPLKINPTSNQSIKPAELNSNIAKDRSKIEAEKVKVVTSVLPGSSKIDKPTYGNPKGPLKIKPTANQSIKSGELNSNIAKIGSESKADKVQVLSFLVPRPSSQSDKNTFGSPKRLRQIYPKANQSIKSVEPNSNIAKDGSKGELDKVVLEPATLPGCLSQGNKQIFETQKCLNEPVKIPKILSTKTNLSSNPVDPTSNIDGHKKAMPPIIGTQHIIVNNTIPETFIKVILQNNNPQIKFDNKNITVQLTNSKIPNDHHMLIKGNTIFGDKPPMYLLPGLPGPHPMGITLPLAFVNSSPTIPVTPSVPARQNIKVVTTTSSTQTKSKAISCEIGKPESVFTSSPGKSKSEEVVVTCCPEDFLGSFSGRSSLEDEQIIENPKTPIEQEKMTPKKTKEPSGIVESDSLINIRKGLIPKMGEVTLNSGQRLKKKVCVIPAKDVLSRNLSKKMIQKLILDQFGVKASYGSKLFNVIANNLKRFKTNYQKQIHRGSTNKLGSNIIINSMRKVGSKEIKKSVNPLKTTGNICSAGEEVGLNTPVEYFQSNILDIVSQDMNKKRLKNSDKLGGKRKRLKQSLPSKFRLTFLEKFKNGSSEQTKNIFNIPTKITNINDKLQMEVLCQTLIEALHRFQDTEVDGNVEMNLVVSIIKEKDIKSDELYLSEKNINNMEMSDIVSLENTTSKKQVDCSGIQNTSNLCSNVTSELVFSHEDKQPVKSVVCKESGMTVKIVSEKQNNPGSDDTEMESSSSYNNIGQTVNASLDHSYSPVTHFAFRNPRYLVKVIENNSKGKQLLKRKVIVRPPPKRLIQKYEKEKLKLQKRICKLSVKIKSKNYHISEKNKKNKISFKYSM